MKAKFVAESFREDSDPIADMGIGRIPVIQQWLDSKISWGRIDVKNETTAALRYCIMYDAPDEYIEFLIQSDYPYDKNTVLSICIRAEMLNGKVINYLLENGAKFPSLEEKSMYMDSDITPKILSYTTEERLMLACIMGDFLSFKKLKNSGVQMKMGMFNHLSKNETFARRYTSKEGKGDILQYIRDNINNLEEIFHPRDHKKLERVKMILNLNKSEGNRTYPMGYRTYKILKFIDDGHVSKRQDIIKFIYELNYGKNTWNPLTDGSYYSDSFKPIYRLVDQLSTHKGGVWKLNVDGLAKLKHYENNPKFSGIKN